MINKKLSLYFMLTCAIFIIDRITKLLALTYCLENIFSLNSYIAFDVVFNRGVSWGMLHSKSDVMFSVVTIMVAMMTLILCFYAYYRNRREKSVVGEICIIAGSLSNLIDRVWYKGVVDFIILSYDNWAWPVFNVADIAIVIGVGILIIQSEK